MFKNIIIYPYVIFFICLLTILFSLNFFYKRYVSNLKIDTRYDISASQFFNLKEKSIKKTLDQVLKKNGHKYLIEKLNVDNPSITLKQAKSDISFVLIIRKNHSMNAEDIERELNKAYLGSINNIVSDIESNLHLFDSKTLEEEWSKLNEINRQEWEEYLKNSYDKYDYGKYDKMLNSEFFIAYPPKPCNKKKSVCLKEYAAYYDFLTQAIEKNYDRLVKSEFFREYPPKICNGRKLSCLREYTSYYNFLVEMVEKNIAKKAAIDLLKLKTSSNKDDLEILQDLFTNKKLFIIVDKKKDVPKEINLRLQEDTIEIDRKYKDVDKTTFYSNKYEEFKNTDFYSTYIFGDTYCASYTKNCFTKASFKLSAILHEHKLESLHPFTVKLQISGGSKVQNFILKDAPLVLGLTTIITYIFFILTNKFFRRKLI